MAKYTRIALVSNALLLAGILTISACSTVPVIERRQLSESLPKKFACASELLSKTCPTWDESFPSARLLEDVRTLVGSNLDLKAARSRVERAAAAYVVRRSALFPSLDASADFDRSRIKEDEEGDSTETRSTIALGAALNWEPDIWGRLKFRKEAAALSLEAQHALVNQIRLDLQAALVESWIAHHAARILEQILFDQRKTNEEFLHLTELRLANGQGNALDVLQQRGRLAAAERAMPSVRSKKLQAANAYAVILGRAPANESLPEDQWPKFERLSALPSPRQLLIARPDLKAAFLALRAADLESAAAVADRLPRFSMDISLGLSGDSLENIGDGAILRFASGLLAPVFQAGRLKANAAGRKAEAREALAVLEQAMMEAVCEVEDAMLREQALFEEQSLLRDEMAVARETVDQATLRYINGQESFLSVLLALAKLQTLQHGEIVLQQDLLINRNRLLKAVGAKWSQCSETS